MLFNKTFNSLMKSIMEDREFDEGPILKPGYDEGTYKYEEDELQVGDNVYAISADIQYETDPSGDVDVTRGGITLSELYRYDPKIDDNVEVNIGELPEDFYRNILDHIADDFLENRIDYL